MQAADGLPRGSVEPAGVLAPASQENGLADVLEVNPLLEPAGSHPAIRGRVAATDAGTLQQHLSDGLHVEGLSRSSGAERVSREAALVGPVLFRDLEDTGSMLVGATPDPADLPLLELLEIGSNRAARFAQRPGQVLLAEEQASGTSLSVQRDVDEQLEGPIGEFDLAP